MEKLCEYYTGPFEGKLCEKPTSMQSTFKRKNDGKIHVGFRCEEHSELTNPRWEFVKKAQTED